MGHSPFCRCPPFVGYQQLFVLNLFEVLFFYRDFKKSKANLVLVTLYVFNILCKIFFAGHQ